eukprot:s2854_g4.t2
MLQNANHRLRCSISGNTLFAFLVQYFHRGVVACRWLQLERKYNFEENKSDDRRSSRPPQKVQRRDTYAVQVDDNDDDSSLDMPITSDSGDEVYAGEHENEGQGDSTDDDIQEILEIQKKAKKDFKKSFKTYKDSKKKVREIKKSRQPFFPVVAIPPEGQGGASSSQPGAIPQGSKKFEKKVMTKSSSKQYPKTPYPRKEEAHLAVGGIVEFQEKLAVLHCYINMDVKDPFRDLAFDGRPAGYREFRRKVILSVASLEDKQQHLAGPRLLNRLSGEAWRATEHLSVASIRSTEGWLEVLKTLDKHYKYLPETELHEAIDEFLFLLRRRGGEGATAFASRFKTQLNRLETLIAQERALTRKKRKKRKTKRSRTRSVGHASSSSSQHSSLEESALESHPDEPHDEPTDGPDETPAEPSAPAGVQRRPVSPMPVALFCFKEPEHVARAADSNPDQQPICMCCCERDAGDTQCSPEGLRPLPEDEHRFRELTKELSAGRMHPEIEQTSQSIELKNGQYHDLVDDKPTDEDMELQEDLMDDADDTPIEHDDSLEPPRKLRRRYTRSPEYWAKRAAGELGPMGSLQEGPAPTLVHLHPNSPGHEESKRRRVTIADPPEQAAFQPSVVDDPGMDEPEDYIEPSLADDQEFDESVPSQEGVPLESDQPDETTDAVPEASATMHADAPENEDAVQLDNAVNTADVGLVASRLDPCLYFLRRNSKLIGICGIHVDDLLGGGTSEMDAILNKLRKRLPFGDYRTFTIRYTGVEIRQNPNTMEIEVGQENYIENLKEVPTKPLGPASTPLSSPTIMRACAGQLAWVATSTRPDVAFLASYLQGVQDKATVAHVTMFNKACRELKEKKLCLRFPSTVPISSWRILCIADAGWGTRENGDSQGGYLLCLTTPEIFDRKRSTCWLVDWSSKKLRRKVRSSVAAETLSGQNGLDAVEMFQALIAEAVHGTTPKDFRNQVPENPAALVVDSKGFFDAVTRSCCSQAISVERRLQIDYSIAKETCEKQNILMFWVNNLRMSADCLTKLKGDLRPLFEIMEGGTYEITVCTQSGRKEKAEAVTNHSKGRKPEHASSK